MRICLFEDAGAAELEPLALTRPVFDLLCGQTSLATKHLGYFTPDECGAIVRPHLAGLCALTYPRVRANDPTWLAQTPTVLVNARWLPPPERPTDIYGPFVATIDDEIAFASLEGEELANLLPETINDSLARWKATLPRCEAGGRMVRHLWDLVAWNEDQLRLDFRSDGGAIEPAAAIVGPRDRVAIHPSARIDPYVVLDTTDGPITIERDVVVHPFTRIEGPCFVGTQSQIQGAKIRGGTTIGPNCRVGGEVAASIFQGHGNKVHDGFVGHSYLGEWTNLGAGTQCSDLRNDYGDVAVVVNGRAVPTGRTKIGCFLGDHTKTGLGTLLNTGTNAGCWCNLLPSGGLLPKYIPSFSSWWNGAMCENADLPALQDTAAYVLGRRGQTWSDAHAEMMREVYQATAGERWRVMRESQLRRLRASA